MSEETIRPCDVLREFVNDVKAAYGTDTGAGTSAGEGDELDRMGLTNDWPDLLVTYDKALAALECEERVTPARHVVVCVESGIVSQVTMPPGVVVEVHDYDVDGAEGKHLHRDETGRQHTRASWGEASDLAREGEPP